MYEGNFWRRLHMSSDLENEWDREEGFSTLREQHVQRPSSRDGMVKQRNGR